jgi:hypothetical protein
MRENRQYVESVQHATLNWPGYGLDPNPALFVVMSGGSRWLTHASQARSKGVVADVRWGSMGDWPEWRFLSDDGRETTWTKEGDRTRYVARLRARIRVATVRWKADSQMVRKLDGDPEHDNLLKVELEASDRRSERLGPCPLPGAFGAGALASGYGYVDDAESLATLNRCVDLGVTFIDTADVSGGGSNERLIA